MRCYSLAYLTASNSTIPEFIQIASQVGYAFVGLRLRPNSTGAPFQNYVDDVAIQNETKKRLDDTGVKVFDIEIIRIGEQFNLSDYVKLLEAGAKLKAKAVLVAADDTDENRLADNYARLCEFIMPYGLTGNIEFMPWTAVNNAKAALKLVAAAGSPKNAGILIDALHFARSASSIQDINAVPAEFLHYAQICDGASGLHFTNEQMIHDARQERLLPGEGSIDLANLFASLPEELPISVEIPNFKRAKAMGEKEWAKCSLERSRQILEL